MKDLNNIGISELEIPEHLKTYITQYCGFLTVGSIAGKTREELAKSWSLTEPQIDAIFNAIEKIQVDRAKSGWISSADRQENPKIQEIIKMVAERFKISEASARSKVMSKGAQMVLTVLFENSGSIDSAAVAEMEQRKVSLNALAEDLARDKVELDIEIRKFDEQKEKIEQEKKEFYDLREQLQKAETAEARDRIRLLDVYNSIVGGINKTIDYKSYIAGAVSILSNTNNFLK